MTKESLKAIKKQLFVAQTALRSDQRDMLETLERIYELRDSFANPDDWQGTAMVELVELIDLTLTGKSNVD